MRCPLCNAATKETAQSIRPDGCVVRTRACTSARPCATFDTVELPTAALSKFGRKAVSAAMECFRRGHKLRTDAKHRREAVRLLIGKQPVRAIATFLGITEARVRQLGCEPNSPDPSST